MIIPVYQAENTIARCIESLVQQNYADAEILLINDGSKDRSEEICREYCKKYDCIRYFRKENGGVSSARNLGLEKASGDYVLFVDSDDYVAGDYFETLHRAVLDHEADLILFNYAVISTQGRLQITEMAYKQSLPDIVAYAAALMKTNSYGSPVNKAFRRAILEKYNLRFLEGVSIAEDLAFVFSYTVHVETLLSDTHVLYYADTGNTESLSRGMRIDLSKQLYRANQAMFRSLRDSGLPKELAELYYSVLTKAYYRSVYSVAKELQKSGLPSRRRRKEIRSVCRQYTEQLYKPKGWDAILLSIPVFLRLAGAIDLLAQRQVRKANAGTEE